MILILSIVVISVILLGVASTIGIYLEKRNFNGGVCPRCKAHLEYFDNDSQGGRGYCCNKCGRYYTWVNWAVVDRKYWENRGDIDR